MKGEKKKPALKKTKQCSASLYLEKYKFLFFIKAEHKRQAQHRCFSPPKCAGQSEQKDFVG